MKARPSESCGPDAVFMLEWLLEKEPNRRRIYRQALKLNFPEISEQTLELATDLLATERVPFVNRKVWLKRATEVVTLCEKLTQE